MSLFGTPSSSSQQTSSLFGGSTTNATTNNQKPNLFGSLNTNTSTNLSNPFAAAAASSNPATAPPASTGKSLFDRITPAPNTQNSNMASTTQAPSSGSLFDRITPAPDKPASSIFGTTTTSPQKTTSLFGNKDQQTQQNQQNQQNQSSNPFGGLGQTTQQNTQSQSGGLGLFGGLGGSTQQNSQGTSTLGGSTILGGGSSLFGQNTNQQNQQQSGQQPSGSSLFSGFGSLGQSTQQQQQPPQQGAFGQSILAPQQDIYPRTKPVMEQMETAFLKWHPQSPSSLFQTYLYNSVPPDLAPFYGPTDRDDEKAWEEALRKKPSAGSIPIAVRGFFELGKRAVYQKQSLDTLRGRLVEINQGLEQLLRTHDLNLSTRTVECRRRHLTLSRRCLALAAKAQVLRNRGYALDHGEEELRKKLLVLEGTVCDPALNGRSEEIWARMVSIRERGRMLERDFEKAGRTTEKAGEIDEAVFERCWEILENHSSQIQHLSKELESLAKEFMEWEEGQNSRLNAQR